MGRKGYVYILAAQKNGTLYIGVTSDLAARLLQHQTGTGSRFAARYGAIRLVWFDEYDLVVDAIAREKAMKKWPRAWKVKLIEERNPEWRDISWQLMRGGTREHAENTCRKHIVVPLVLDRADLVTVTAWIPDTLRSFHSLTRSGTTEAGVLPQISNPIGWQTRCLATSQH